MLKTLECRDKKLMKIEFDVYTPIKASRSLRRYELP